MLQHFQVLRHGRPADGESVSQFADRLWLLSERRDDGAPRAIAERVPGFSNSVSVNER
jgi:hypothetical protein